ncbi:MAG: YhcH/YjgK/YiaL family protein [Synergistaceae bacterium]|jgi:YhcH/YjgK/YiaL family protein|nr:YhcH/YjgK/YiaL family protein [Synergistaceae bacterium]
MILDSLKNARIYYGLGERFEQAFKFLENVDAKVLKSGRIDITDGLYASVQMYNTIPREQCLLESHKKYADIQYVVKGEEVIGFSHLGQNYPEPVGNFDEAKDLAYYKGESLWIPLREGYYCVLFPDDLHAPKGTLENSKNVIKIVFKVLL